MIKFSIGGRSVDPNNLGDALMHAALQSIREQLTEKLGAIRDPDSGEFPMIIVRGDSLENLSIEVEGSPNLVAMVKRRLGTEEDEEASDMTASSEPPRAFLSYTSDDVELARKIAEELQAAGIETWWDQWCINPGDSLRQKIDDGLAGCTHFLVLLTPQSINKPWVNAEMDAALVRKLNDQCKFLPVRSKLPASSLPPLLAGVLSPEIAGDADISQLIRDIHGVTRKPPLGEPPPAVAQNTDSKTGYSAAANCIARWFVEKSIHGDFADPQINVDQLAEQTGLSADDTADGLFELSTLVKISLNHVLVQGALFAKFDRYWKPWDTADDALRLAADIMSDPQFPHDPRQICDLYGWEPRRLNPVVYYLQERDLIVDYQCMGTMPYATARIVGKADTMRRFVKSRA